MWWFRWLNSWGLPTGRLSSSSLIHMMRKDISSKRRQASLCKHCSNLCLCHICQCPSGQSKSHGQTCIQGWKNTLYLLTRGAFNLLHLYFYVRYSLSCWAGNIRNLLAHTLCPFSDIWTIVFVMFCYVAIANCSCYSDCICYQVSQPFCIFRTVGQWVTVLMFKFQSQTQFLFSLFSILLGGALISP